MIFPAPDNLPSIERRPARPATSQQPEDRAEEPSASKEQPDHMSVLNEIVDEYRRHQLGPDPTTKLRENVGCQIYRIKKFIVFMAEGKGKLSDFCFLNETAKLHAWVSSLRKANMTVTTIQHYVMNVGTFFSYIAETPSPSCRLSRNALIANSPGNPEFAEVLEARHCHASDFGSSPSQPS
ncbi:hypothetical protein ROHU_004691 [Labeo rohita]|uniref:Uncharacterized protein n=1 Tax=Labeo rohita TaxID=84645 RepID=A0A498MP68_LABRO|nr:hypothetical protein ROHU_023991 [Labeo rohita]RXN32195.1 hypothetical protein ROHU_004691 [Labeo rohita]